MSENTRTSDESQDDVDYLVIHGEHLVNSILARMSIEDIQKIMKSGAPLWYQNEEEGMSPLHAAAYTRNVILAKTLIECGAIWNAVDKLGNTAGDIALSYNDTEIYMIIRGAGIRSELLLSLLSSRGVEAANPASLILRATDTTASGSTDAFLHSRLRYTKDNFGQPICMLSIDEEEVGVMMGWEKEIMQSTVEKLYFNHPNLENLKVLNIGFGLGIIDDLFQTHGKPPSCHVIIEPHPDVLEYMKETGWFEKPGVKILQGKWQDYVESDILLGFGGFDIIYTDTFSEDYESLRQFFEHIPDLMLGTDSRFSFFNGLGATNALFYDVYTRISEVHLADLGIEVEWDDVDVIAEDVEKWGKSREYFTVPTYRLPICRIKPVT
ncbi:arginine methyl transferase [Cyathus striatus]|nr:arginine methyl transferase [Cyathus striatus]